MKKFRGKLTLSFPTGGKEGRAARISLDDDSSGVPVVQVELTMEEFGLFISGLAMRPCEYEAGNSALFGASREVKSEQVVWGDATKEDAVAPFEVDGWRARLSDVGNYHNRISHDIYNVMFFRFVDPYGMPIEIITQER